MVSIAHILLISPVCDLVSEGVSDVVGCSEWMSEATRRLQGRVSPEYTIL